MVGHFPQGYEGRSWWPEASARSHKSQCSICREATGCHVFTGDLGAKGCSMPPLAVRSCKARQDLIFAHRKGFEGRRRSSRWSTNRMQILALRPRLTYAPGRLLCRSSSALTVHPSYRASSRVAYGPQKHHPPFWVAQWRSTEPSCGPASCANLHGPIVCLTVHGHYGRYHLVTREQGLNNGR